MKLQSITGALGAVNSNAHRLDGQRFCFRLEFVDSASKMVEKYGKYLIPDMHRFFVVRKRDRQGRSPAARLPGFFLACGDGYVHKKVLSILTFHCKGMQVNRHP